MAKIKVLVVDDSAVIRQVLSEIINRDPSLELSAAVADPIFAMKRMEQQWPDVIVLDIEMPRMNGYEFMSALRAQPTYQKIPVIMLTSRTAKKHRQKARSLGVTDFMVKPYEDDEFIALVKRYTGQNRDQWLDSDI